MPRARMKIVRNPLHPRQSVISGKAGGGKHDIDLIDLGADPINRYGVVYITTVEAAQIAELIGWVDGALARDTFALLEEQNRELRAQIAALPLALTETTERLKDGLDAFARDLTAGYDAALSGGAHPDPLALPDHLAAERAAVELGDSGRAENLELLDGGPDAGDGAELGGHPVDDGGAGEQREGDDLAGAGDQPGADRGGEAADGTDDVAGGVLVDAHRAGHHAGTRITDLDAGDGSEDAGDA